jgi:hypothetical protein
MYSMSENTHLSDPQDICLLLRAHCEQRWLIYEVLPVLRQLETPEAIPEDQLGAALAYLELLWLDARRRARETDGVFAALDADDHQHDPTLYEKARRYHAAVRRLRVAIGQRISERTRIPDDPIGHEHAGR